MFTGIIEEIGQIKSLNFSENKELRVNCSKVIEGSQIGDSIAVDGVCLTIVRIEPKTLVFQLSPETFEVSLFRSKKNGSLVNLERALPANGRLGGHIVQGHVDGRATLENILDQQAFKELTFSVAQETLPYIITKGSVALNGISLTVAKKIENCFMVALIPVTLKETSFSTLNRGDQTHIETDMIARYVESFSQVYSKAPRKFDASILRQAGWKG